MNLEDLNVYVPDNEKERRVTLNALRSEANRNAAKLSRERRTDRCERLSDNLRAINELVSLYEHEAEFEMTENYRNILLAALGNEKKHRKTARHIANNIEVVPHFCEIGIGGINFTDIF